MKSRVLRKFKSSSEENCFQKPFKCLSRADERLSGTNFRSLVYFQYFCTRCDTHIQLDSSYFRSAVMDGKHISLW